MAAKKMVEYSVSVPADSKTSFSVNHTPGGTTCIIESGDTSYDVSSRQYVLNEDEPRSQDEGRQPTPGSSDS
ncbi:hypothetical protein [Streptomyces sp. NPDC050804]|uniref:hypothetical protein n=1 Tax=Streptomyces sp. NPDC050804 TaxID=3154745 RepID=UPI0034351D45